MLVGLYKSNPIDQGMACVGVQVIGNIFTYGNSIASTFSFLFYLLQVVVSKVTTSFLYKLSTVCGLNTQVTYNWLIS